MTSGILTGRLLGLYLVGNCSGSSGSEEDRVERFPESRDL